MRINNNLSAFGALNSLLSVNNALQKTITALSTGLRINSAADDAAGLAVSEKMRTELGGLGRALKNTQDGISLLQTAESALGDVNSCLQRMRELSLQAANDTLTTQDRNHIQLEIDELKKQIDRISDTTQFNRKRILDGSCSVLWSCDDVNVKAKINGGLASFDEFGQKIDVSGNYRINVQMSEGQPEIQKSKIMLINHEDVAMNRNIIGVSDVGVKNLPAGHYEMYSNFPTESRAVITGSYGMEIDEFENALTAGTVDSKLTANASVLFEVVEADSEHKTLTVNAISHVLNTDGTSGTFTHSNIKLNEDSFTELGEILGVGEAGGFLLQVSDGMTGEFSAGDKFVYSLNAAGGVNGVDRAITFRDYALSGEPEDVAEGIEVYRTNTFTPKDPVSTSAKVVFLIDNSGSMSAPFQTVQSCISSFLSNIKSQGVDEVSVAVARYTAGLYSASEWVSDDEELRKLLEPRLVGSVVNPYRAVYDAVNKYYASSSSPSEAKHIVLITDTGQEVQNSSITLTDAQNALKSSGVTLSAVYRGNNPQISPLVTADGLSLDVDGSTWGTELVDTLAGQIGLEAVEAQLKSTTCGSISQLAEIFPDDNSPNKIIRVEKNNELTNIAVNSSDTIESITAKLDTATGGRTTIELAETESGEVGVCLKMELDRSANVKFSGDTEILRAFGFSSNLEQSFSLDSTNITNRNIHLRSFTIDSTTGQVNDGEIIITTPENALPEHSQLAEFDAAYVGEVPAHDVTLRDINNFWNNDGVFMLTTPQAITITRGDGLTSEVMLYETDTIEDVRRKLDDAMTGATVSFVYEAGTNGSSTVAGTFIIASDIPGRAGEFYFSGSEDVINAFGLNTIQEAEESSYTLSVYDAHSGKTVTAGAKSSGNVFHGVISPNIDIEINEMTAKSFTLHLQDNSAAFQTGADKGESITIELSDVSANALGIESVNVATRETASRALSTIDNAINRVSTQRAELGAYTNALEHTMNALTVTTANLTNAESRIRDADMAQMMMEFVKLQILNQSGTSMLAQANQLPQSVLSLIEAR